jgi:hypothetical protein
VFFSYLLHILLWCCINTKIFSSSLSRGWSAKGDIFVVFGLGLGRFPQQNHKNLILSSSSVRGREGNPIFCRPLQLPMQSLIPSLYSTWHARSLRVKNRARSPPAKCLLACRQPIYSKSYLVTPAAHVLYVGRVSNSPITHVRASIFTL